MLHLFCLCLIIVVVGHKDTALLVLLIEGSYILPLKHLTRRQLLLVGCRVLILCTYLLSLTEGGLFM